MKHNITFINQPLDEQRWLMWPDSIDELKPDIGMLAGDVYRNVQSYLKNMYTVTVDFSRDRNITVDEARRLVLSVPQRHWKHFSLWGMNDAVRIVFEEVMSGK